MAANSERETAGGTGGRPPSIGVLASITEGVQRCLVWPLHDQSWSLRARELMESGARLVAVADKTRPRIEQDLHDGAQNARSYYPTNTAPIPLHLDGADGQLGGDVHRRRHG